MNKFDIINSIYSRLQKDISEVLFIDKSNKEIMIGKLSISALSRAQAWTKTHVQPELMRHYLDAKRKLDKLGVKKVKTLSKADEIKKIENGINRRLEYIHNSIMFFVQEFIAQYMKSEKYIIAKMQSYSTPIDFRKTQLGNDVKKEVRKSLNIFERYTKSGYLYRATLSRGEIEKRLKDLFIKKFGNIDFVAIKMKNGKIRRYTLKTYTNMLARTEMRYIQTRATKLACQEWKNDLVRVLPEFVKNCSSGICATYAGNVYSLSGNSKVYPVLDEEPPFHPYCIHSLSPTTQEGIDLEKEREAA